MRAYFTSSSHSLNTATSSLLRCSHLFKHRQRLRTPSAHSGPLHQYDRICISPIVTLLHGLFPWPQQLSSSLLPDKNHLSRNIPKWVAAATTETSLTFNFRESLLQLSPLRRIVRHHSRISTLLLSQHKIHIMILQGNDDGRGYVPLLKHIDTLKLTTSAVVTTPLWSDQLPLSTLNTELAA